MSPEQFRREKDFGAALAIAAALLGQNLITLKEFGRLKAALVKKYRPAIGSLRENAHPSEAGGLPKKSGRSPAIRLAFPTGTSDE